MKQRIILASLAILAVPALASARTKPKLPAQPPAAYQAVLRCRSLTDQAARLACFDSAVAALDTATRNRELVMVDREQVRRTRRSLFGLSLPNFDLFGDDDEAEAEEVKRLEGEIASVGSDQNRRYIIRLKDGSIWRQIDGNMLGRQPKPGYKVVINRTITGSYMMQVAGQPGIRVKRTI
ncbi:MAG TPA: hypothetical protein VGW34_15090 [Allosphingosinicella sp.]|nr:hypothetical protein [Allosphingosinicella sp.]